MKKTILGITAVTIGLLMTGCGDNSGDVAKDFASALSSADIKEAKSLSSARMIEKIDNLQMRCSDSVAYALEKQTNELMNKIMEAEKEKDFKEKEKEFTTEYKEKQKEIGLGMKDELEKKYGKDAKPSMEIKRKVLNEVSEKMFPSTLDLMQKLIKLADIEVENQEQVEKASAWYYINHDMGFATRKVLEESPVEITEECVNSHTNYGFIEDINIMEIKEITADEKMVRLELIDKDDHSNKVNIHVEKIKNEWKVSNI